MVDILTIPDDLPVPVDDGGADGLIGTALPRVPLTATTGESVILANLPGRVVVYAYPKTGQPGRPLPTADWDLIPGARGCTPQSCAFRDHFEDLRRAGVAGLFGLSTQATAYQQEAARRLHLPFPLLSDESLAFSGALGLPTFAAGGETLLMRLTMIVRDGVVEHVFYPVFPPDRNAADVLRWISAHTD